MVPDIGKSTAALLVCESKKTENDWSASHLQLFALA
jgi:hypothetical protein